MLKRTPFYDFHVAAGARLVEFAGWEMPLLYRGINEEHHQTRNSGSIFDVSHMGRLYFSGADAATFLERIATRRLADMKVGQSRYSLICNETGGVLDDVIISRDQKQWLLVCNASNREKLLAHFSTQRRAWGMDFDLADQTESTAMVAIQGPKVIERLKSFIDVSDIPRHGFAVKSLILMKFTIFRGGYTGEDGVEIILPAKMAGMAMKMLAGKMENASTILPAGLGARDTLRLEAALPLYGHELEQTIDPFSAGLGWAVDLSKDFLGAAALKQIHADGPARRLVGLELEGRRIARQGAAVLADGRPVGVVTSGTFGPTVQKSIAMVYVDIAAADRPLSVDLKNEIVSANVVKLPFYRRPQ